MPTTRCEFCDKGSETAHKLIQALGRTSPFSSKKLSSIMLPLPFAKPASGDSRACKRDDRRDAYQDLPLAIGGHVLHRRSTALREVREVQDRAC